MIVQDTFFFLRMSSSAILHGLTFVFGGCCTNVLSLESLIKKKDSDIGIFITFIQFCFISLTLLPKFITFQNSFPRFKPLHVPIKIYLLSVILFYISSYMNNIVFKYHISIPLHIVFRCFSVVITMIISWLINNKKYNNLQILSAIILTIGAIITSLYRDHDFKLDDLSSVFNTNSINDKNYTNDPIFIMGLIILIISSLSSSLLSVYNEWTFKKYGKNWEENLFYTHFLSLPIFLIKDYESIRDEFNQMIQFESVMTRNHIMLIVNIITQNICIRGVNILASYTNALTLSVILTARKFISLLLSVIIYDSHLSITSYIGVIIVFIGTLLYTIGSRIEKGTKHCENEILEKKNI